MTENTPGSVHRRTVVAGAAWTIPVVATAIGAPLAAASGETPTLAFTNGPYSVAACGTLKDIVIKATLDGTSPVPADTLVTVSLPAGLTWSNGETGSRALPTDANGEVVLSGLKANAVGGSAPITASTTSATASAVVDAAAGNGPFAHYAIRGASASNGPYPGIPAGATIIGDRYFLTTDGTLLYNDGFTTEIIATDVTDAKSYVHPDGRLIASWTTSAGAFWAIRGSQTAAGSYPGIPADATIVGDRFFVTTDGTLLYNDGYTTEIIATGVTDAKSYVHPNTRLIASWTTSAGAFWAIRGSASANGSYPGIPADATVVGDRFFVTTDGTLLYNDGYTTEIIATGVIEAKSYVNPDSRLIASWTTATGAYWVIRGSNPSAGTYPGIPADVTVVGDRYFLTPDGTLLYNDGYTTEIVATGVLEAESYVHPNGRLIASYMTGGC